MGADVCTCPAKVIDAWLARTDDDDEATAGMAALLVHVTTCAAALQLQFAPVKLTNVKFGSSVSVTVIRPELVLSCDSTLVY